MKKNLLNEILAPLGLGLLSAALWAGDTAIVDGQNAEDVVGQTDAGGNAVFTDGTPYDSQRLEGFNLPYDVEVDTVSHRLFVCDYSSSRIMVYDLDSSNALVDRTADRVLGQTGFYQNLNGTTANTLNFITGIDFHAGSNRLFVADQGNTRHYLRRGHYF
ncbi:MAG: hypothetical protein IPN90_02095 [Elusimicrobia bacterium]|nr:hypothetical protein [Elusimicrobiota bacterium]